MTRLQLDVRNCRLNLGVYLNGHCVHLTAHRGGRWLAAITDIDGPTRKFELTPDEATRLHAVGDTYSVGDANAVAACIRELERMGYLAFSDCVRDDYDDAA